MSLSPAIKTAFKNTSVSPLKRNDTEVYTPRYEEGGSTTERNRDYGDRSYKEEKEVRRVKERPSERPSEKPKEKVKEKEIEKSEKKPSRRLREKEKDASRSPISIRNQTKSPATKTEKGKTPGKLPSSLVVNVKKPQQQISTNIFSAIEQDLSALNEELRRKESEFEHLTIKTTRKNYNHYNDDFGHTLQKLRQILEGEEEFHY